MEYKTDKSKINEKRNELNKLIEVSSSNLLSDDILRVSQELDNLISTYLFYQNTYKKTKAS
ncbi:hypothetical protein SH2C18_39780 [Clostridium sediminicola]|uniref:aspartyl-phosphate phosphatase Spo0E family protein n=1 Tax=Clostridium sediminicola TaxID=3114879 RepID=UPI0031F1CE27